MMNSHTKETAGKLCGVLIFTLLLVLIPALKFDFYYDLNDDTAIKDILSGAYTGSPSGYCIQMLFPLSWLIAVCYTAIPTLPWYGLFLCVCQFGVIVLVAWRLLYIIKNNIAKALSLVMLAVIVLGLFMREFVIVQYSVTSGICMSGACFLFITGENTDKLSSFLRRNTLPALLVILSFMIRSEVCIMLLPFLLLAGLSRWGSEKKIFTSKNFRKYLILIGSTLLGMFAVLGVDRVAYGSSEWSNFRSLFDARTRLYDFYGIPPYNDSDNAAFYASIGLSQESYTLLENYNFALDESIDSWLLDSIADYRAAQAQTGSDLNYTFGLVSKNSIREALWLYKEQLLSGLNTLFGAFFSDGEQASFEWSGKTVCSYAAIGTYVIYILVCFLPQRGSGRRRVLFKILGLVVIRSVLWLYLYMVDRAIDRVTIPLLMTELATLTGFILNDFPKHSGQSERSMGFLNNITDIIICIFYILFMWAALVNNYHALTLEYNVRERADSRWNALIDYCMSASDNYYIIDVYSSTSYEGASYSEKIFNDVDNSYRNFDICGGWVVKSPLYRQKLAKAGLRDIQSALYANRSGSSKTYFIAACDKELDWLSAYYEKRGFSVMPALVDIIVTADGEAAFTVYELK